ncbi:hypothetical protein VY88_03500 [Azospirillum thiophilum]|uniref:Uncharacterized protein n=2 Tax=Azospirillum thiophilum TaxID=528244 RepID=A0AAC8VXH4_9PROT|nr:hypothetical protein AL072_09200 [Azospirillum thiophilum]KJR65280.1 hypothetical protein VY88_03500 [Azospirillum thiophilum]
MRARKKMDSVSPILEQILYGGSSVSMNLIAITREIPEEQRMFKAQGLNNSILFKYPSFDDRDDDGGDPIAEDEEMEGGERPVETGIYVPHNARSPEAGGVAVYLRGRNSAALLEEQFGIKHGPKENGIIGDMKMLSMIDDVPSLDAFLLKTCFEAEKVNVDPRHWLISNEEDHQLRRLIRARIEPIVRKALSGSQGSAQSVERFLEAIWNPNLEEAGLFVSAFGIERSEADTIFSAWKGTTFYEYQLRRIAPRARTILTWLKSRDCIPVDIRMHKPYETQLLMHIEKVGKLLETTLLDIRTILSDYETSFSSFMNGQPEPFRDYLRSIRSRYWLLGYCVSALTSVAHLDARCMKNTPSRKLYFEGLQKLLRQFDVALDRRREQKGAF